MPCNKKVTAEIITVPVSIVIFHSWQPVLSITTTQSPHFFPCVSTVTLAYVRIVCKHPDETSGVWGREVIGTFRVSPEKSGEFLWDVFGAGGLGQMSINVFRGGSRRLVALGEI